jgi:hypothetical protein
MYAIQHKRTCRVCGCTDDDCSRCIEKTGEPCHWVEEGLCSACAQNIQQDENKNYFIASLFVKLNGVIIREITIDNKKKFALMVNAENLVSLCKDFPDYNLHKFKTLFESNALRVFPTKKGALGWCRRHNVFIAE